MYVDNMPLLLITLGKEIFAGRNFFVIFFCGQWHQKLLVFVEFIFADQLIFLNL